MALERASVYAAARRPGFSRNVVPFAALLLFAFATFLVSQVHAGWIDSTASQLFNSAQTAHHDSTDAHMVGVHGSHIIPGSGSLCPEPGNACCAGACSAFAHLTEPPDVSQQIVTACLGPPQSRAVEPTWRSAAFRPPIS